jgi:RNA polymerase sigma-70 factor (ECF subfamily)
LLKEQLTYDESELVQLLNQRSQDGFSYLYTHYSGALFGIITNLVSDTQGVEDVLQEVFVRIFRKIELYDAGKSRLFTWMAQIARNAAIDWLRQHKHLPGAKNQMEPDDVSETVQTQLFNPDHIGLAHWVSQLEEAERTAVRLAYFEGLTQEEISKQTDTPLGTVKSRIRSGLRKLRLMMKEP